MLADPEVQLSLTGRSGPLVVEIEYRVAQENARAFHNVMQDVQLSRQRNGAYGWSIARDIADPELWTERYHCPTWLDYLRQRNRSTQSERALHQRADRLSSRARSGAGPPHAGAAVRIGALEGRNSGPRRRRSVAGRDRGWRKYLTILVTANAGTTEQLLPVIGQDLFAGLAEPGAVLLQAGQHHLSPSFICARQNRATSRAQASWPCWAEAAEAIRTNGTMKKNLVITLRLPVMIISGF